MIDHIGYEVSDLATSGRFYDALFFALGVRRLHENAHVIGWGVTEPVFWLTTRHAPSPSYGHIAFRASGKAAVDAAHAAGLAAGGASCEDPPGPRDNQFGRLYLAYLRDPDGNKLCAMHRPK